MTSATQGKVKEPVKPKVSIDNTNTGNYHSNDGSRRIDSEIQEVVEGINEVLTNALKKHKSPDSTKKFLSLLEKTLVNDAATNYVAVRLLITERLVQAMLPSMLDSLTMAASKFTKSRLEDTANELFERETHSVMMKLLGMEEDSWHRGNLKVDHCNGRESAITKYIKENSGPILERIAREALDDFDKNGTEKMKKAISSGIVKEVKEQVERSIWRTTESFATKKAEEITQGLVDSALENKDVFKSLCLAKPDNE